MNSARRKRTCALSLFLLLVFSARFLMGCAPDSLSAAPADLPGTAAAQATAIVAQAMATALILKAQAQATGLSQAALAPLSSPESPSQAPKPGASQTPTPGTPQAAGTSQADPQATASAEVDIAGVSLAEEGQLIMVRYSTSPEIAHSWSAGMVYVIDEASGTKYSQIPIAGPIGPLFNRPVHAGQMSYIMFVNSDPLLQRGASVTVVLGKYQKEHILVQ